MSDLSKSAGEWKAWREWSTLSLQTNSAYPEVGLLTLNRPERLNAVNPAMMEDLHGCLDFLNHAFDCRAALKFEDRNQVLSGQTDDALEGVMAFFEKRRPKYGPR